MNFTGGFVAAIFIAFTANVFSAPADVRLYALDCGRASAKDFGFMSDTGEYDGKPGEVAVPCFVVRHPKGILVWDTGLGDKMAEAKGGVDLEGGIHMSVGTTLAEQLKAIGIAPADVAYVAFSHMHADHTGNANLFAGSTWILNRAELAWALSKPEAFVQPETFSAYKSAKTEMIAGDHDVFGDGAVRILRTPGHTPGHQVLMLRLRKAGSVILSGDLWHLRANLTHRRVPAFNVSRADTLASMDRVLRIAKNTHARIVVQHDPGDFARLPKFPAYLD